MKRASEILGLPVISADNGKKIGIIKEVLFDKNTKSVVGFLLEPKSFASRKNVVLKKDVLSLGDDALIINDEANIVNLREVDKKSITKSKNNSLIGLRVLTKKGEDLGVVKDVLFDPRFGTIDGVLLSDGLLQDIVNGRNLLPLFGKVEFGDENILVEKEAVEEILDQHKGIKNILLKD